MQNPLRTRQQFSCGTITTTILIEDSAHPDAITLNTINMIEAEFLTLVQREVVFSASNHLDAIDPTGYSRVKQTTVYEAGTTTVTLSATLVIRRPGIESDIRHDVATLLSKSHYLVDDAADYIKAEVERQETPVDPFGFGAPYAGMPVRLGEALSELFSGTGPFAGHMPGGVTVVGLTRSRG